MKCSTVKLLSLLLAAGLLLGASPAVAAIVVAPDDIVRVSADLSDPTNINDSGGIPGTIKIRERLPNNSQFSQHISAFVNFDLSFLSSFDPSRGDTAVFELDYQGALNAVYNVPMFVGQITGGAWDSSTLPQYKWATKSGGPIGPGSQTQRRPSCRTSTPTSPRAARWGPTRSTSRTSSTPG